MKHRTLLSLAATGLALAGFSSLPFVAGCAPEAEAFDSAAQIEHGRYLVHQVAMCIDCHSPRGADGRFVADQHLTGALLPFAATVPMPWAPAAPGLAGLPPGYTADDTVQFLMTGERPHGRGPALPPMPEVRFSRADAEAVTAYLASLAPSE